MAKDYKNVSVKKTKKRSFPGWAWLATGLAIGLFVAFLVYLKGRAPDREVQRLGEELSKRAEQTLEKAKGGTPSEPQEQVVNTEVKDKGSDKAAESKPRFDFYSILPEMEVLIPDIDLFEGKNKEKIKPVSAPGVYVLQVGSFRKFEEADRLKASLALMGIQAEIQKVTVNAKDTFHRVRVGPYQDLNALNKMRKRLQEHNIESMLLKVNA